jgi:hypothetical protein
MAKIRIRAKPTLPRGAWEDDPASGNARPTPEQIARGSYDLIPGERCGVRVAVNRASCVLDRAHSAGKLSAGERDAGIRWRSLRAVLGHSSGPRSCLDWSPRGADGDFVAQAQIDASRKLTDAHRVVNVMPGAWSALVDVVEMGEPVRYLCPLRSRRFRLVQWALATLADHWGLSAE